MNNVLTLANMLNVFSIAPDRKIKTIIELIRSGFHITLCSNSIKELLTLWNNGTFLSYQNKLTENMIYNFKVQTYFDIGDFLYAYWCNKNDWTTLGHHALIIFLCQYYGQTGNLSEGIMIFGAMSNQFSAVGFDLCKILTLYKENEYVNKLLKILSSGVLVTQLFYRIPIIFCIITYGLKYAKDTNSRTNFYSIIVKFIFCFLQLYNEYAWIKWTLKKSGIYKNKFTRRKSLFILSLMFSYYLSKNFYQRLQNYKIKRITLEEAGFGPHHITLSDSSND